MKHFDSETGYEIVGTVSGYREKVRTLAASHVKSAVETVVAVSRYVTSTVVAAAPHLGWHPDPTQW